eukprot:scaffold31931_cov112-Isochrysis_galbana.AAC.2
MEASAGARGPPPERVTQPLPPQGNGGGDGRPAQPSAQPTFCSPSHHGPPRCAPTCRQGCRDRAVLTRGPGPHRDAPLNQAVSEGASQAGSRSKLASRLTPSLLVRSLEHSASKHGARAAETRPMVPHAHRRQELSSQPRGGQDGDGSSAGLVGSCKAALGFSVPEYSYLTALSIGTTSSAARVARLPLHLANAGIISPSDEGQQSAITTNGLSREWLGDRTAFFFEADRASPRLSSTALNGLFKAVACAGPATATDTSAQPLAALKSVHSSAGDKLAGAGTTADYAASTVGLRKKKGLLPAAPVLPALRALALPAPLLAPSTAPPIHALPVRVPVRVHQLQQGVPDAEEDAEAQGAAHNSTRVYRRRLQAASASSKTPAVAVPTSIACMTRSRTSSAKTASRRFARTKSSSSTLPSCTTTNAPSSALGTAAIRGSHIQSNQKSAEGARGHSDTYKGIKKHPCPVEKCGGIPSAACNLKSHLDQVHKKLRPFKCGDCAIVTSRAPRALPSFHVEIQPLKTPAIRHSTTYSSSKTQRSRSIHHTVARFTAFASSDRAVPAIITFTLASTCHVPSPRKIDDRSTNTLKSAACGMLYVGCAPHLGANARASNAENKLIVDKAAQYQIKSNSTSGVVAQARPRLVSANLSWWLSIRDGKWQGTPSRPAA